VLVEHDLEHLTVPHEGETTSLDVTRDIPRTGEVTRRAHRIVKKLSPNWHGRRPGAGYRIDVVSSWSSSDRGHRERAREGQALITVTMEGAAIRIRPTGRLDAEMTATIKELLASAGAAGTRAELDVSELDQRDRVAAAALVTPAPAA